MLKFLRKYKKYIKWGAIALGAVFAVGATAAIAVAVTKSQEDTRKLNVTDYACYALVDETGLADKENKGNISSRGFYTIDGFKADIDKDAEVTYQLNFYDEDKVFLSVQNYSKDFNGSEISSLKSQGVCYVRVEIIPLADSDGEVSYLELPGYVSQLKVTIQKEADDVDEDEDLEEAFLNSEAL